MNTRLQIVEDRDFWVILAFDLCGLLAESQENEMRGYWVDDLIPQSIENTKAGVEVSGIIWVGEGNKRQLPCRFLAKIPQTLLHKRVKNFRYDVITFDTESKYVEFEVYASKQPPLDEFGTAIRT